MRAGQQVAAAVASERQVGEVDAGDRFGEDDRDVAHAAVARVGSHRSDRRSRRGGLDGPRVARVGGEQVARRVADVRSAGGQRERVAAGRSGERRQIAERPSQAAVARRERFRTGQQVAAAVASQREVADVESRDRLAEADRD